MRLALVLFLILSVVSANEEHPSRTKRLCSCSQLMANPCTCQPGPRARCSCVKPVSQRSCTTCPIRSQFSQCRDSCRRTCNSACSRGKLIPSCPSSCATSCSQSCLDDVLPINVMMPKTITAQQCVPVCKQSCGKSCGEVLPLAECDQLCEQPCERRCAQMLPIFMQEKKVTTTTVDSHILTVSHCPQACRPNCEPECINGHSLYERDRGAPRALHWPQSIMPGNEHFPIIHPAAGPLNGLKSSASGKFQISDPPAMPLEQISGGKIPRAGVGASHLPPPQLEPYMEANNGNVLKSVEPAPLPPNDFYPLLPDPTQTPKRPGFYAVGGVQSPHTGAGDQRYLRPFSDDRHKIISWPPLSELPHAPQMLNEHFGESVKNGAPIFAMPASSSLQSVTGSESIATHPEIAREELQYQLHPSIRELGYPDSNSIREELYPLYPPPPRYGADFKPIKAVSSDEAIAPQLPRETPQLIVKEPKAISGYTHVSPVGPFPYPNQAPLKIPYKENQGTIQLPVGTVKSIHQASQGRDAEFPSVTVADETNFKCPTACMPTCDPQCVYEQELLARESLGRISAGISLKTQELAKKIRELESALENAKASNTSMYVSRSQPAHRVP